MKNAWFSFSLMQVLKSQPLLNISHPEWVDLVRCALPEQGWWSGKYKMTCHNNFKLIWQIALKSCTNPKDLPIQFPPSVYTKSFPHVSFHTFHTQRTPINDDKIHFWQIKHNSKMLTQPFPYFLCHAAPSTSWECPRHTHFNKMSQKTLVYSNLRQCV